MTTTTTPSLLDAILRLEQHAEGRRVARKALREATDAVEAHLCDTLRVGDAVTVHGRRYELISRRSNVGSHEGIVVFDPAYNFDAASTCDALGFLESGLPAYLHGDFNAPLHSVDDGERIRFAEHAAEILAAFADLCKTERERMTTAAESARTQRV